MSVHKKLMQARLLLQNKKLEKSGHNNFAGYKYFELGDFLPAINEIFSDVGLCGVVSFSADLATLTLIDTEDASQVVITSPMGSAALKGCHEVQNIGAVETYQRRYLWVSAMEIVEHDALDAVTGSDTGKPVLPPRESAKSIAKDVWDNLPPEEQNFLHDIAIEMVSAFDDGDMEDNHRLFYKNNLDNEQQTALWSRLDSKHRAATKKYSESLKG